ncbi:S-type pyocin domain-containing protein [Pseudomonas sp. WOUb67]|uniref:S-type pyocin domain-containing protein n=1 Tax=Pseudomonas sp. WOUb67 TaxID=3161136 RepID=UPI003CF27ABF
MTKTRGQIELPESYVDAVRYGPHTLPPGYSGPVGFPGGNYNPTLSVATEINNLSRQAPEALKAANDIAQGEYLGDLHEAVQMIESDVQTVKQEMGERPASSVEALKQDIAARHILIERKLNDLNFQRNVANRYFGSTPLGKNPMEYAIASQLLMGNGEVERTGLQDALIYSFRGAYRVQLREAEIQMLQGQITALHQAVANAEAQAHADAEAQRIAHAEALVRAHVEAQAQADAEAQAQAHEEALRRAHEVALKIAHEQALARMQANAEARKSAREAAAARAVLQEKAIREANTYKVPLSELTAQSAVVMATGAAPVLEAGLALGAAIRAAVASLGTASLEAVLGPALVGTFALLYSPKLGNGELQDNYLLSVPLADISVELDVAAQAVALERGVVDLPLRMGDKRDEIGPTELFVAHTDGALAPSAVPVLAARFDAQSGHYVVTTDDVPSRTLLWTPAVEPSDNSTTLPVTPPPTTTLVGPKLEPLQGRLDVHPDLPDVGFDDYIIIFPADSGLPPLYVMFKNRRYIAGEVVGKGELIKGEFLYEGNREGAPVPMQIASKMRGRTVSSWNAYRRQLWRLIGRSSLFEGQFDEASHAQMLRGLAPFAPEAEWVGGRTKYEIHHIKFISEGGGVYDNDNLVIVSPKFHIEIHR